MTRTNLPWAGKAQIIKFLYLILKIHGKELNFSRLHV